MVEVSRVFTSLSDSQKLADFQILLEHGADINAISKGEFSPLYLGARYLHAEVIEVGSYLLFIT